MPPDVKNLIEDTENYIRQRFEKNRHHVACGLVTESDTYFSLHLDTSGYDICAEPIALSNALQAGDRDFKMLVATYWNGDESVNPTIVTPCGDCRQMLVEYAPNLSVIIDTGNGIELTQITDLLPYPYVSPGR